MRLPGLAAAAAAARVPTAAARVRTAAARGTAAAHRAARTGRMEVPAAMVGGGDLCIRDTQPDMKDE